MAEMIFVNNPNAMPLSTRLVTASAIGAIGGFAWSSLNIIYPIGKSEKSSAFRGLITGFLIAGVVSFALTYLASPPKKLVQAQK